MPVDEPKPGPVHPLKTWADLPGVRLVRPGAIPADDVEDEDEEVDDVFRRKQLYVPPPAQREQWSPVPGGQEIHPVFQERALPQALRTR